MNVYFADTFYFVALLSPRDQAHQQVLDFSKEMRGSLLTTQWVLTEVLDGFANTPDRTKAAAFLAMAEAQPNVVVIEASDDWFRRGMQRYEARPDKEWSLTDCISFAVMEEYALEQALTADRHFEQAGFKALLK